MIVMKNTFTSRRAFTFIDLLIAMIITAILGGAAVSALWFIFGVFNQTGDYVSAYQEIEFAAQRIGREMTHVGLGMPNNRQERGSFALSFESATPPPMALMGEAGEPWGGPITIGLKNSSDVYDKAHMTTTLKDRNGRSIYEGPELFYAWGVPTGVRVKLPQGEAAGQKKSGTIVTLDVLNYADGTTGLDFLERFQHDNRRISLSVGDGRNPASWILLPTTSLPMLVNGIDKARNTMEVTLAPGASDILTGPFTGLDEVVYPQAARLYRSDNNELVQIVFGADYTNPSTNIKNVLARNIVGLHFAYDPELRIVTMYIAAKGDEGGLKNSAYDEWPDDVAGPLPTGSRIVVNRVDWRIRN